MSVALRNLRAHVAEVLGGNRYKATGSAPRVAHGACLKVRDLLTVAQGSLAGDGTDNPDELRRTLAFAGDLLELAAEMDDHEYDAAARADTKGAE